MKHFLLFIALLLDSISTMPAAENAKPNVLLILTDDQGAVDAGCYGAKDLATPHFSPRVTSALAGCSKPWIAWAFGIGQL